MNKIKIGAEEWIDGEGFQLLNQAITPELTESIEAYRQTIRHYVDAYGAREDGTTRRKAAVAAQDQAIAKAIEDGLSPQQVFDRVGADPVWMPNNFAVKISDLYGVKAKRARKHLLSILRSNSDKIITWLEEYQSKTENINSDAALVLEFVTSLSPAKNQVADREAPRSDEDVWEEAEGRQ